MDTLRDKIKLNELDELEQYILHRLRIINKSVDENLLALISKIGEKITLGRSKTLNQTNTKIFKYHHTIVKDNLSKLGVLVSVDTNKESDDIKTFGKQLSMHIAASNPLAIDVDGIDQDVLKKEEQLINEELKNLGKPEDIVKKISVGKIKKFKEDNSLLNQQWVMEPKKKVKDIIKELNIDRLKINDFLRIKIGE